MHKHRAQGIKERISLNPTKTHRASFTVKEKLKYLAVKQESIETSFCFDDSTFGEEGSIVDDVMLQLNWF